MPAHHSTRNPGHDSGSRSAYFEHLFQSVPAGVVLLDRDDRVIDFNKWFADQFGYTIEEAEGQKINDLIVPDHFKQEGEQATRDVAKGQPIFLETIRQNKAGQLFHVSISGQPISFDQGEIAVIGVYHDITDRKRTEEALRESEEKLRTIFQHANIGFTITDPSGKFILNNKWHADFLGYPQAELQQKTIRDITHPEDYAETQDYFSKLIQNRLTSYRLEKRFICKDGTTVWGDVSISATKDDAGQVKMVIGMIKDITEKKQAEHRLKKSEQNLRELNATKDTLISILSHDLRSPFTAIMGFAELLLDDIADADRETLREQVKVIRDQADNTLTLLNDILSWARLQSGKAQARPVPVLFTEACMPVIHGLMPQAAEKDIQVECAGATDITLLADMNMLQAVLRNLIANAIKFTPYGGRIQIKAAKDKGFARITVADKGVGIEANNIPKLWDLGSMYSTEGTAGEKGTGYGLVLCKELVEQQEGKIWVESNPGEGSDFIFTLPLA